MANPIHERIVAAVIFAAALFFINLSRSFPPDSRIFPYGVLGLMAVLAAVIFARSFFKPAEKETTASPARPFFESRKNFWAAFGAIFCYIALLPALGYFTSSLIFFVSLTWILGYGEWKKTLLTVGVFLVFVYVVFIYLFERPIPPEFFQTRY